MRFALLEKMRFSVVFTSISDNLRTKHTHETDLAANRLAGQMLLRNAQRHEKSFAQHNSQDAVGVSRAARVLKKAISFHSLLCVLLDQWEVRETLQSWQATHSLW